MINNQIDTKLMPEKILLGVPVAPGIAIGQVLIYRHDKPEFRHINFDTDRVADEIKRLEVCVNECKSQLKALRKSIEAQAGDTVAQIFFAQAAILDDSIYFDEIKKEIDNNNINAEYATQIVSQRIQKQFEGLDDISLKQKAHDVQDVGNRLIRCLLGSDQGALIKFDIPSILVADDLLPSDVIHLLHENILGVVTDFGGVASHTAILTRALDVPAIVGLRNITRAARGADQIIVNGNSGKAFVNPDESTVQSYRKKQERYQNYKMILSDIEKLPAVTADGHRIALCANLELPQEATAVASHGGEGIGLFRTEFLFLTRKRLPTEDEQVEDYKKVISAVLPYPVTIRTFDLGGDKIFQEMPLPIEANPFMGWRAIRVTLDQEKIMQTQLRAILRAAIHGKVRILIPFISGVQGLRKVKSVLTFVKSALKYEGVNFNSEVPIGVMIELPSSVMMAEELAAEAEFFSIGTNDLTQFTLAVDRGNETVRKYFQPLHPAMIKMYDQTIKAAKNAGIEVGMCGELAANPLATMLLVGLGLDELSVSPAAIPEVKKLIRSMTLTEALEFAEQASEFDTAAGLIHFCIDKMKRRFADLPIWFNGES